jgi:hypothetical protein
MMGNTNITGRIPCKLFEDHAMKTVMFSVNQLEGGLPACVLEVRGGSWCLAFQAATVESIAH